jgi:hypothetical protein
MPTQPLHSYTATTLIVNSLYSQNFQCFIQIIFGGAAYCSSWFFSLQETTFHYRHLPPFLKQVAGICLLPPTKIKKALTIVSMWLLCNCKEGLPIIAKR